MESIEVVQVPGMSNAEVLDQLFGKPVVGVDLKSEQQYHTMVDQLKRWNYFHYNRIFNGETITDANYDDIVDQVAQYEENHPKEVRPDSPVGKVRGGIDDPAFNLEPHASQQGVSAQQETSA